MGVVNEMNINYDKSNNTECKPLSKLRLAPTRVSRAERELKSQDQLIVDSKATRGCDRHCGDDDTQVSRA